MLVSSLQHNFFARSINLACQYDDKSAQTIFFRSVPLRYWLWKFTHLHGSFPGGNSQWTLQWSSKKLKSFRRRWCSVIYILYDFIQGGAVAKALDLSFRTKEFAALESMADDLDENTDPEILMQCADFFISHGQHERAVPILVSANKVRPVAQYTTTLL